LRSDIRQGLKYSFVGFVASTVFLIMPYIYIATDYFSPQPYSVQSLNYEVSGDDVLLTASFNKSSCEFRQLDIFGKYLGEWFLVPYTNTLTEDYTGDRIIGEHTMRITAGPITRAYTELQIRTRHLCGEDDPTTVGDDRFLSDKIFGTVVLTNQKDT